MAAPNSDNTDPIASTYQFRAFAERDESADSAGTASRSRRGLVVAALVVAVLVVGALVIVLAG